MACLAVDSVVFAYVEPGEDSVERSRYERRLLGLQRLAGRDRVSVYVPASAFEELESAGIAPPWADAYGENGDRDIIKLALGLLERCRHLEDWSEIQDLLVANPGAIPGNHLEGRPKSLVGDYHRTCAIIMAYAERDGVPAESVVLVTSGVEESVCHVRLTGRVDIIEPDLDGLAPFEYNDSIAHIASVGKNVEAFDPCSLWKTGEYDTAISLAIAQSSSDIEGWPDEEFPFEIRTEFIESLAQHGFTHIDARINALVRECANVVLGRRTRDSHHLREGVSGSTPTVRRSEDGAVAWRRDIDREYRMHYWKRGAEIEFALVAPHNEFTIPE